MVSVIEMFSSMFIEKCKSSVGNKETSTKGEGKG